MRLCFLSRGKVRFKKIRSQEEEEEEKGSRRTHTHNGAVCQMGCPINSDWTRRVHDMMMLSLYETASRGRVNLQKEFKFGAIPTPAPPLSLQGHINWV